MCRQANCFYSLFLTAFEVEKMAREGLENNQMVFRFSSGERERDSRGGSIFLVSLAYQLSEKFTCLPLKVSRAKVCLTVTFRTFCVAGFAQFSVNPHGVTGSSQ